MRSSHGAWLGACAGLLCAVIPATAPDRIGLDWLGKAMSPWVAPVTSDVALVLLDSESQQRDVFASSARVDWSGPLAAVLDALLDAGASVVGMVVIFTLDERLDPAWLATLRRGAREGRLVLGVADGPAPALPSARQRSVIGGRSSLAWVHLHADRDGVIRRIPPTLHDHPTLAAELARRSGADPAKEVLLGRISTPSFPTWSAHDVLHPPSHGALVEAFAGRIVLVGAWLPGEDRHRGPMGHVPGVWLHALATDAWVHDRSLRAPGRTTTALLLLVTGLAAGALGSRGNAGLVSLWAAATPWAAHGGWVLPWLGAVLTVVATLLSCWLAGLLERAWRADASLPAWFGRRAGATEVDRVTVCFIDIASFTETSEHADPAELARDLGACLSALEDIIEHHGGFVDKFLGDGLMAIFGSARDEGARSALNAMQDCLRMATGGGLRILSRPVSLRAGMATGPARLGALGDGRRLHFTAIGDVVNVAARLEQLNRELGTHLLADAGVAHATPDMRWRDMGARRLRGRTGEVHLWAL